MTTNNQLQDRLAIQDLQVEYARALDANEWARLDTVFLPGSIADYDGVAYCDGLDAIKQTCTDALGPLTNSQHMLGNHWATVDGDRAEAGCYFQAQHVRKGTAGGDNYIIAGTYTDKLVRTANGWRIEHRVLKQTWTEGNASVLNVGNG